jgi:hypothetical protein
MGTEVVTIQRVADKASKADPNPADGGGVKAAISKWNAMGSLSKLVTPVAVDEDKEMAESDSLSRSPREETPGECSEGGATVAVERLIRTQTQPGSIQGQKLSAVAEGMKEIMELNMKKHQQQLEQQQQQIARQHEQQQLLQAEFQAALAEQRKQIQDEMALQKQVLEAAFTEQQSKVDKAISTQSGEIQKNQTEVMSQLGAMMEMIRAQSKRVLPGSPGEGHINSKQKVDDQDNL